MKKIKWLLLLSVFFIYGCATSKFLTPEIKSGPNTRLVKSSKNVPTALKRQGDYAVAIYTGFHSSFIVAHILVYNNSSKVVNVPLSSVSIIDGYGGQLKPMSPDQVMNIKYGGTVVEEGRPLYSTRDAISSGIASGFAKGMREAQIKAFYRSIFVGGEVLPGSYMEGDIYFPMRTSITPIKVVVKVKDETFYFTFIEEK